MSIPGQTRWATRWLGGMCAAGAVGGLAVRGPDYAARPALAAALRLPDTAAHPSATIDEATAAWSALGGAAGVLLLRNPERARALLLQALALQPGDPVGLPANADRALVEAIKRQRARPFFLDLDEHLQLVNPTDTCLKAIVAQSYGGLGGASAAIDWLDAADTVPLAGIPAPAPAAILYGLHLDQYQADSGALLVFGDRRLADACAALVTPADMPNPAAALAQYERLYGVDGIVQRQYAALAETWRGLNEAAGLPLLPLADSGPLPHGVALQIPTASDYATFYAYVRAENTPVRWMPEIRPLHYAALRDTGRHAGAAAILARWLIAPVGPDYSPEEISHTILGIVKTADYLGVRWIVDPHQALEYAAWMDELYGADHDAYRPLFDITVQLAHETTEP